MHCRVTMLDNHIMAVPGWLVMLWLSAACPAQSYVGDARGPTHTVLMLPFSLVSHSPSLCRDIADVDNLNRLSMACPALPMCGLAITEAERGVVDLLARVRTVLSRLGFDESVCPQRLLVKMEVTDSSRARPPPRMQQSAYPHHQ